ncbi:hypothetical protein [Bacillus sp. B-jedd]|uniref:hypothetical protein n=1 Tax=Bacillus sp. B-jedd TaxID=1476857 RepID=UPI0005155752|nr:hypothetical protein [Bacillus sp. B-jedd]CEG27213.1 hypothetical protein BN1002_02069 [Bacillus sp. B-jedd]
MEKQRTLFYGFIIGFALLIVPIPRFFFWMDMIEAVASTFRYLGFIIFLICGIPLIIDVFKVLAAKR